MIEILDPIFVILIIIFIIIAGWLFGLESIRGLFKTREGGGPLDIVKNPVAVFKDPSIVLKNSIGDIERKAHAFDTYPIETLNVRTSDFVNQLGKLNLKKGNEHAAEWMRRIGAEFTYKASKLVECYNDYAAKAAVLETIGDGRDDYLLAITAAICARSRLNAANKYPLLLPFANKLFANKIPLLNVQERVLGNAYLRVGDSQNITSIKSTVEILRYLDIKKYNDALSEWWIKFVEYAESDGAASVKYSVTPELLDCLRSVFNVDTIIGGRLVFNFRDKFTELWQILDEDDEVAASNRIRRLAPSLAPIISIMPADYKRFPPSVWIVGGPKHIQEDIAASIEVIMQILSDIMYSVSIDFASEELRTFMRHLYEKIKSFGRVLLEPKWRDERERFNIAYRAIRILMIAAENNPFNGIINGLIGIFSKDTLNIEDRRRGKFLLGLLTPEEISKTYAIPPVLCVGESMQYIKNKNILEKLHNLRQDNEIEDNEYDNLSGNFMMDIQGKFNPSSEEFLEELELFRDDVYEKIYDELKIILTPIATFEGYTFEHPPRRSKRDLLPVVAPSQVEPAAPVAIAPILVPAAEHPPAAQPMEPAPIIEPPQIQPAKPISELCKELIDENKKLVDAQTPKDAWDAVYKIAMISDVIDTPCDGYDGIIEYGKTWKWVTDVNSLLGSINNISERIKTIMDDASRGEFDRAKNNLDKIKHFAGACMNEIRVFDQNIKGLDLASKRAVQIKKYCNKVIKQVDIALHKINCIVTWKHIIEWPIRNEPLSSLDDPIKFVEKCGTMKDAAVIVMDFARKLDELSKLDINRDTLIETLAAVKELDDEQYNNLMENRDIVQNWYDNGKSRMEEEAYKKMVDKFKGIEFVRKRSKIFTWCRTTQLIIHYKRIGEQRPVDNDWTTKDREAFLDELVANKMKSIGVIDAANRKAIIEFMGKIMKQSPQILEPRPRSDTAQLPDSPKPALPQQIQITPAPIPQKIIEEELPRPMQAEMPPADTPQSRRAEILHRPELEIEHVKTIPTEKLIKIPIHLPTRAIIAGPEPKNMPKIVQKAIATHGIETITSQVGRAWLKESRGIVLPPSQTIIKRAAAVAKERAKMEAFEYQQRTTAMAMAPPPESIADKIKRLVPIYHAMMLFILCKRIYAHTKDRSYDVLPNDLGEPQKMSAKAEAFFAKEGVMAAPNVFVMYAAWVKQSGVDLLFQSDIDDPRIAYLSYM